MNDKELLELAAKAAGIGSVLCYEGVRNCLRVGDRKSYKLWSPLTDDGDALMLAAKLELDVEVFRGFGEVWCSDVYALHSARVDMTNDRAADYRRAITICAAEIGKDMQ